MKIIDCRIVDETSDGTVVNFYLGEDGVTDYWGDDWNDCPYEHNAGTVYDKFVSNIKTVTFPPNLVVLEPCDDWVFEGNSPYTKETMAEGLIPCLVVVDPKGNREFYEGSYVNAVAAPNAERYYFNDPMPL